MDVYVFSKDLRINVIDDYKAGRLPRGVRYAASITGPWHVLAIYEVEPEGVEDDCQRDVESAKLFLEFAKDDRAIASETALVMWPAYLKKSVYRPVSAFVRIHIGAADPDEVLPEVRRIVADPAHPDEGGEAESVMGSFDILAYAGGSTAGEVAAKIGRIRALPAVQQTLSMYVLDYVSTSPQAPPEHKPRPARSAARSTAKRSTAKKK